MHSEVLPVSNRTLPADTSSTAASLAADARSRWRLLVMTLTLIALWWASAWVFAGWYVERRAQSALVEAQQRVARDSTRLIADLERSLALFQGIVALASRDESVLDTLVPERADPRGPSSGANAALARSVRDARALTSLWAIKPDGRCVATSNGEAEGLLVGANYADRDYFKAASGEERRPNFSVERAGATTALFVATPVHAGKRFVGVIAGRIDLDYFSPIVDQAHALISDRRGVIIKARDKSLEWRALPAAPVQALSESERAERYRVESLPEIPVAAWESSASSALYRFNEGGTPLVLRSRATADKDLSLTVLRAVPEVATQAQDRNRLFFAAVVIGASLFALAACAVGLATRLQRARGHREHETEIEYLESHDALTGLFSRAVAAQMISHGIAVAARSGCRLAVVFMDLDMFKDVNDSMGHESGDLVLQEVARRLRGALRASDPVIRYGGDEFVVLLNNLECAENASQLTGKILESMKAPFEIGGVKLCLTASLGIAVYPDDGDSASILLRNADSALHRSKAAGRSSFCFYHASMNAHTMALLSLENELREALARQQFVLHYQPQYSLAQQRVIGCEALVRWQHPTRGLLPPADFLPASERCGLVVALGEWVVREACRQASLWRQAGLIAFPVAVNLSALQFRRPGLVQTVERALADAGLPASGLELELTESAVMENTDEAARTMQALRALGVGFSIDDFGTGYSSLSYLKRFSPDVLKIDRSFVREVETDANDLAIVEVIVGLGHSLHYRVIAEGVETESQLRRLEALGLQEIQGFWFSKPLSAAHFAGLMRRAGNPAPDRMPD